MSDQISFHALSRHLSLCHKICTFLTSPQNGLFSTTLDQKLKKNLTTFFKEENDTVLNFLKWSIISNDINPPTSFETSKWTLAYEGTQSEEFQKLLEDQHLSLGNTANFNYSLQSMFIVIISDNDESLADAYFLTPHEGIVFLKDKLLYPKANSWYLMFDLKKQTYKPSTTNMIFSSVQLQKSPHVLNMWNVVIKILYQMNALLVSTNFLSNVEWKVEKKLEKKLKTKIKKSHKHNKRKKMLLDFKKH